MWYVWYGIPATESMLKISPKLTNNTYKWVLLFIWRSYNIILIYWYNSTKEYLLKVQILYMDTRIQYIIKYTIIKYIVR